MKKRIQKNNLFDFIQDIQKTLQSIIAKKSKISQKIKNNRKIIQKI